MTVKEYMALIEYAERPLELAGIQRCADCDGDLTPADCSAVLDAIRCRGSEFGGRDA